MRRLKFLERGFGVRRKTQALRQLADQRRLDGTKTKTADKLLKLFSNLMQKLIEPARVKDASFNKARFTREQIIQGRKKFGKE